MADFKIGDRVRTTEDVYEYGYMGRKFISVPIGTFGTISRIDGSRVRVEYDNQSDRFFQRFFISKWNLEIVNDNPTQV